MQRPKLREITQTIFDIGKVLVTYDHLTSLPDCNDCAKKDCEYRPKWGEPTRINCPFYEQIEPKEE